MKVKNILSCIPKYLPEELIENIAGSKNCKIERIISRNHKTAAGKWYNQDQKVLEFFVWDSSKTFSF